MRNVSTSRTVLPVAAAAILGGCAGPGPDFTLQQAYVTQKTETDALVRVVVKADNPTQAPIPMWAIGYSGQEAGAGKDHVERWTQATVPAGGSISFELPVVVPAQATGSSTLGVSARVAYVSGGKLRELLTELDYPLPTTTFSGSVPIDWNAPVVQPVPVRVGSVRTAIVLDPGPVKPVDTLPPLPQATPR